LQIGGWRTNRATELQRRRNTQLRAVTGDREAGPEGRGHIPFMFHVQLLEWEVNRIGTSGRTDRARQIEEEIK